MYWMNKFKIGFWNIFWRFENPSTFSDLEQPLIQGPMLWSLINFGVAKCFLLHGNRQKETDTETEKIFTYYDFMRFGDSSTVPNILNQ